MSVEMAAGGVLMIIMVAEGGVLMMAVVSVVVNSGLQFLSELTNSLAGIHKASSEANQNKKGNSVPTLSVQSWST